MRWRPNCACFRFMDDILIPRPTRWHLRGAAKMVNQTLGARRIERGFDFLGYHFSRAGLSVGKKTIAHFIERHLGAFFQHWVNYTCAAAYLPISASVFG